MHFRSPCANVASKSAKLGFGSAIKMNKFFLFRSPCANFASNMKRKQRIELLAPARDVLVAIEAISHGADAVYIGANKFGARSQAGNDVDDLGRVCEYAHKFDAKVYATVNTIVYDNEFRAVERLVADLYRVGVDALIVQDMSLLRLDLPPIALHASTQCDIRTVEKARFLEAVGFSQLVLARELSLDEIARIRAAVKVPLEAFVHGALCVSYSGRCQASEVLKHRSANRGECAQLCRLPYDLEDATGRKILQGKHLLSLRDMNRSQWLKAMIEAGVSSFKIEGRLKDAGYVKNVVAYYRRALDAVIESDAGESVRSSFGTSTFTFTPAPERSFNRQFTSYFIDGHPAVPQARMASIDTPKSRGELLGTALHSRGAHLRLVGDLMPVNGDGLSYIDSDGQYTGIRVNEVHGDDIVLNDSVRIKPGTKVYRTFDKNFNDVLLKPSATRKIAIDVCLKIESDNNLVATIIDERGNHVTHTMAVSGLQPARSSQSERQRAELSKLGNTIYELRRADVVGECFIPASVLAQLRRDVVECLDRAQRMRYTRDMRRVEQRDVPYISQSVLSADNVANALARKFYQDHGVTRIEPAVEVQHRPTGVVMTTRYCLRRELGACRRESTGRRLPDKLYLRADGFTLEVKCDCKRCEMMLEVVERRKLGKH